MASPPSADRRTVAPLTVDRLIRRAEFSPASESCRPLRRHQQQDAKPNRSQEQRSTESGFTLLEVLVATALMGIAIVGLLSLVNRSVANAAAISQYDRAAMLARSQMDTLLAISPLELGGQSGVFDETSGWSAVVTPRSGGRSGSRSVLVRIVLTIWWQNAGERRSIELEGYRRLKMTPQLQRQLEDRGALR